MHFQAHGRRRLHLRLRFPRISALANFQKVERVSGLKMFPGIPPGLALESVQQFPAGFAGLRPVRSLKFFVQLINQHRGRLQAFFG